MGTNQNGEPSDALAQPEAADALAGAPPPPTDDPFGANPTDDAGSAGTNLPAEPRPGPSEKAQDMARAALAGILATVPMFLRVDDGETVTPYVPDVSDETFSGVVDAWAVVIDKNGGEPPAWLRKWWDELKAIGMAGYLGFVIVSGHRQAQAEADARRAERDGPRQERTDGGAGPDPDGEGDDAPAPERRTLDPEGHVWVREPGEAPE